MILDPPGEPTAMTKLPEPSKTNVGDIELRGRLPGSARLAMGAPFLDGAKEKSVNWLFSINPPDIIRDPKAFSMLDVIETALPNLSTTLKCVVDKPCSFKLGAYLSSAWRPGIPGDFLPPALVVDICLLRKSK